MIRARILRRIWPDRSGSAIVEFALICPILVTLLLGLFDLAPSMMVKFKVASATETVADLATQSATMQISDIVNYVAAGSDVMAPFSGTPLALRITNIASDGLGNAFVYWSCGSGTLPPKTARTFVTSTPTGTPVSNLLLLTNILLPLPVKIGTNTSFVMVESTYTYTAPAGLIFRSAQTLSSVAYAVPRVSTFIGPMLPLPLYVPIVPTLTLLPVSSTSGNVTCSIAY